MTRFRLVALVAVATAALVVAAPSGARSERTARTTVGVTMKEFKFVLTRRSVPAGRVVFHVVNRGKIAHDFAIAGKKTKLLKPGRSQVLVVTLKKGRHPYRCTVDSHAKLGMKGVLKVT